jgi:hypothetical protein
MNRWHSAKNLSLTKVATTTLLNRTQWKKAVASRGSPLCQNRQELEFAARRIDLEKAQS